MSNGISMTADQQDRDDGRLVKAVLRGEMAAFEVLVSRYQRQATAVAYRLLNNRDDAMEIVQDAFLKAYDRLDTLSKAERFRPWLMRIVSNLALNRRRGRALRKAASLEAMREGDDGRGELNRPDTHMPTPAQEAEASDLANRLAGEIEKLPEVQRKALLLFSVSKLPQAEVAEILETSVEAVKWHVFSARKKLKEALKDEL